MQARVLIVVVVAALFGSVMGVMVMGITASADTPAVEVPGGAVVAFASTTCPSGWSAYTPARGRMIVGVRPGGTLGGTTGVRLDDLEVLSHQHVVNIQEVSTSVIGGHRHTTFRFSNGTWETGGNADLMTWSTDGVGNEGGGYYPVALADKYEVGTRYLYTNEIGSHGHTVDPPKRKTTRAGDEMPYVQLKYCEKD